MRGVEWKSAIGPIFGYAYLWIAGTAGLVLTAWPALLVAGALDLRHAWPLAALLAPLLALGLRVVFAMFAEHAGGGQALVKAAGTALRHGGTRALVLGLACSVAFVVLGVDIVFMARSRGGQLVLPFFVVLALLVVLAATVFLVDLGPRGTRESLARVAVTLLGQWHLHLFSLVILVALLVGVVTMPVVALLLCVPALFVVWSNERSALNRRVAGVAGPAAI